MRQLIQVGLCAREYIDREVSGSLSGGEIKRIEIATVLARRARLSVFDEPEAHGPVEFDLTSSMCSASCAARWTAQSSLFRISGVFWRSRTKL